MMAQFPEGQINGGGPLDEPGDLEKATGMA
jgi:hypothetical protein